MISQADRERLGDIQAELSGLHIELSQIRAAEREAYSAAYWAEDESHARAKEAGRLNALRSHLDTLKISGRIEALREERDHIRFCIQYQ